MGIMGSLEASSVYIYHPNGRLDLQSLPVFAPSHSDQPLDLINNPYLNGIPSTDQTTKSSFYLYTHLPLCYPNNIMELLHSLLTAMHRQGHNTDPDSLSAIATVSSEIEPPPTEYDDEPITSDTHLMDPTVPYRYIITLPTQSPPAYGLILLSNRQVTWTVNILESFVTCIPNALREAILSHTPTVTRAAKKERKKERKWLQHPLKGAHREACTRGCAFGPAM